MISLDREIRKYNITAVMYVRGKGSRFGGHERRCLWPLCGKPMMQWTLEAALASKYVNKVVLTSEDPEIIRIGEKIKGVMIVPRSLDTVLQMPRGWNAGVFQRQRPRSLFSGDAFREPGGVSMGYRGPRDYVLWYLEEQESFVTDIDVEIPANQPLGTVESLDKLIEAFFLDEEANKACTIYPISPNIYFVNPVTKELFPLWDDHGLDRQCYPFPLYRSGPFLIHGKPLKATFSARDKIAYTIIPEEQGADVHDKKDLEKAKYYLARRLEQEKKSQEVSGVKRREVK
ncbi:hypothetical protein ES703_43229 [subsurface metagenome]